MPGSCPSNTRLPASHCASHVQATAGLQRGCCCVQSKMVSCSHRTKLAIPDNGVQVMHISEQKPLRRCVRKGGDLVIWEKRMWRCRSGAKPNGTRSGYSSPCCSGTSCLPVAAERGTATCQCRVWYGHLSVPCMVRLPVSDVYGTVTCQWRVWYGYLSVPCMVRLPVSAVYGAVTCQCRVWYGYLCCPDITVLVYWA